MMKKLLLALTVLSIVVSMMAFPASAVIDMVEPVGDVYAPEVTTPPTLDGVINENEWPETATFRACDYNMKSVLNAGFFNCSEGYYADVTLAWDSTYLYLCYNITDPTTTPRPAEGPQEGDYIAMYFDFGPTIMMGDNNLATCIIVGPKEQEDGNTSEALFWLLGVEAYDTATTEYGITVREDGWVFEGRVAWEAISNHFQSTTGETVTPADGLVANSLQTHLDFNSDYTLINWMGTSVTGYEVAAAWVPEEYGITINFLGANAEIPERPETTLPVTTPPESETDPVTTEKPEDSSTPDTTPEPDDSETDDTTAADSDKDTEAPQADESGLPTGAIIGIVAAVVVVIVVVVLIVVKKKAK